MREVRDGMSDWKSPAMIAGIGSCFAAAIYEVGRPARLSSNEATQLEKQWQDFGKHFPLQSSHWLCNAICHSYAMLLLIQDQADPSSGLMPVFSV